MKQAIAQDIEVNLIKCAVAVDAVTSNSMESFLGMTCHYIDTDSNFKSLMLALKYLDQNHDSKYIHECIVNLLNDWKIADKVCLI